MINTKKLKKEYQFKPSLETKLNSFFKILDCTYTDPNNFLNIFSYLVQFIDRMAKSTKGTLTAKALQDIYYQEIDSKYSRFYKDPEIDLTYIDTIKKGITKAIKEKNKQYEDIIEGNEESEENKMSALIKAFPFVSHKKKADIEQGLIDFLQDVLYLKRIDCAKDSASRGLLAIFNGCCYVDDIQEIQALIDDIAVISKVKSKIEVRSLFDSLLTGLNNPPEILQQEYIALNDVTIRIDLKAPLNALGEPNIKVLPHTPTAITFNALNCDFCPSIDTSNIESELRKYAIDDDTQKVSEETYKNIIQSGAFFLNLTNGFKKEPVLINIQGNNGKSTFLNFIKAVYGAKNCSFKDAEQLTNSRFVFAELYGKRINIIDEVDTSQKFATAVIKRITGGAQLTYDQKFCKAFDFTPRFKNIYGVNDMPYISDKALLRRWYFVPFKHNFPIVKDYSLVNKNNLNAMFILMLKEYALMLDRANKGESAFTDNPNSKAFLEDYQRKNNPVYDWIMSFSTKEEFLQMIIYPKNEQNITNEGRYRHTLPYIYKMFKLWCEDNGKYQRFSIINQAELKKQLLTIYSKEIKPYDAQIKYAEDIGETAERKKYQAFLYKFDQLN